MVYKLQFIELKEATEHRSALCHKQRKIPISKIQNFILFFFIFIFVSERFEKYLLVERIYV